MKNYLQQMQFDHTFQLYFTCFLTQGNIKDIECGVIQPNMYVCDVSGLRFMYTVHLGIANKWHAVSWLIT